MRTERCACGGLIRPSSEDWWVIRRAVAEHNLTGRHLEWRAMGGDVHDPEMFGRLPMEPTADVSGTIDVSGTGLGASAPSEDARHLCGYELCMTWVPAGRELCRFHSRAVMAVAA